MSHYTECLQQRCCQHACDPFNTRLKIWLKSQNRFVPLFTLIIQLTFSVAESISTAPVMTTRGDARFDVMRELSWRTREAYPAVVIEDRQALTWIDERFGREERGTGDGVLTVTHRVERLWLRLIGVILPEVVLITKRVRHVC